MQIQKGEVFTNTAPGKTVTDVRLNNHVDLAILLPGAITDHADVGTDVAADDTLLLHDLSVAGLRRVQTQNLIPPATISGKPDLGTGIAADDTLLVSDTSTGGTLSKVQAQNILPPQAITAKPAIGAGAAQDDVLLISDTSAAGVLNKITVAQLLTAPTTRFTSALVPLAGLGVGKPIDTAHGLGTVPRFVRAVLVCTIADLGYAVGDEVGAENSTYFVDVFEMPNFAFGANATNVWVSQAALLGAAARLFTKTGGFANPNAANWSLKVYAGI